MTQPLTADLAERQAADRRTTILIPPSGEVRGGLFLWPAERSHLVRRAAPPPPTAWLAVTWTGAGGGRLDLVDLARPWRTRALERSQEIPPVDLGGPVGTRPQPVLLEAVALVVRFELAADLWRRNGDGPLERRRVQAVRLDLERQNIVVHDLDRNAARSFKLADLAELAIFDGQPIPRWIEDGWGYVVDGVDR